MSFIRQCALPFYRWATQAKREVFARRFTASQQWPAAILFYHRVANQENNPWTISQKHFSEHLDFVDSIADFSSLDEIRQDQRDKTRLSLKIAITFDDGYADNMDWAIPELIRREIPCTYFVSTDFVEGNLSFPHDVERGLALRPNSIAEIRQMAEAGIQIGGHTRSHLDLGRAWTVERLRSELIDSRKKLQDWTGQSVDYFAFPYGLLHNISQPAIDVVIEAGYQAFLSAYGAWNFPNGEDTHLTRFHGDPCAEAVRNWLTLDPRHMEPRSSLVYSKPNSSNGVDSTRSDTEKSMPGHVISFPSIELASAPFDLSQHSS